MTSNTFCNSSTKFSRSSLSFDPVNSGDSFLEILRLWMHHSLLDVWLFGDQHVLPPLESTSELRS
ncbi:hypothetical protein H5410_040395 [Solanum commersonii]|uniref:Uncharacterized protein n=1 Tax=Solanum commersonii TaxID=4109 RepID=A0A9J5XNS8_SOLCO|nr:hypothetical protein H5410_040395 [Solanum commersonii]